MSMRRQRKLAALFFALFITIGSHAQTDSTRVFTEEDPLIYEDAWDLWPYSFLNDSGEPNGYIIDLVRMLMEELNIPYRIKLKPQQEAFNDLKEGKADLTLGLAVGFNDSYGLYGRSAVTLFTQSLVRPKGKPLEIEDFKDLGKPGISVIVNAGSLCHHLMVDYGWGKNAKPSHDIRETIQKVSADEDGQIVWNTLSLKWLLNRYKIDNLEMTPVNMPHGEYRFMSNNQQLLDQLDDVYTRLNTTDELIALQNQWFYPERQQPGLPAWMWYIIGACLLLLVVLTIYTISFRLQSRRLNRNNQKQNRHLALILQTSHVRIWTYDIKSNLFSWRNENGQIAYTYSMEEFSQRYSPGDFKQLKEAIDRLSQVQKGEEEEEIPLSLRAMDAEGGDSTERDYYIVLSVLNRDDDGKPTVIIGMKKDVTEEKKQKRLDTERTLRYWAIFNTPIIGVMFFDKDGRLRDINPKACEMLGCEAKELIDKETWLKDIIDIGDLTLEDADGFRTTKITKLDGQADGQHDDKLVSEFHLMTIYGETGELLGAFAVCRDITATVTVSDQEKEDAEKLEDATYMLNRYTTTIDHAIRGGDIRVASYSPDSHLLTILNGTHQAQHELTQTRCMTLVDESSKKIAMRMLNDMDGRTRRTIEASINTTLRSRGGSHLSLYFKLEPVTSKDGKVKRYLGLMRDLTEQQAIEEKMALETAKVQEVEHTKTSFVKNMVQEIRTPMSTIIDYVSRIDDNDTTDNEEELRKVILENADSLLHLIDNVLYLSRLQARMVEIHRQPRDFAELFASQCSNGWTRYQNAETHYLVENPYEQLVVDIDADNLGHVIEQVTANAAQHTKSGVVRARVDYIGRRLMISIDDTGEGIPAEEVERLNEMDPNANVHVTKGLGLAIAKELVSQMDGTIEISSEEGSGTTVYIMLPCHASVIKRKKLA